MQQRQPMDGLRRTLAQLEHLQRKFEKLLAAAHGKPAYRSAAFADRPVRLREGGSFGSNPGNLRMRVHIPDSLPNMPALVVALHGCTQSADDFDHGSGWSMLADRFGFIVVYPQQQPSNN